MNKTYTTSRGTDINVDADGDVTIGADIEESVLILNDEIQEVISILQKVEIHEQ